MNHRAEIMRVFHLDPKGEYTINEVSKSVSKPYGTTYNYVHSMISDGSLRCRTKGRATLCSLNFESHKAIELLGQLSFSDKAAFEKEQVVLCSALSELVLSVKKQSDYNIYCIVLFGSIAKGSATPRSDVDLFFITPSKDAYDDMIEIECNALRMRYDREVSPLIVEPRMYIQMLQEREENVAKQILKGNVVIFGANKFWELTLEGLK